MSLKPSVADDESRNRAPDQAEPELAPPGAGLPFIEWAIAKYVLLPHRLRTVDLQAAVQEFAAQSTAIEALAKPLSESQMSSRRLIPRLRGLEDSSRFWSVAMTMQHLIIVNNRVRGALIAVTDGKGPLPVSSTADVKPPADIDAATISTEFSQATQSFLDTVGRLDFEKFPDAKFAHPWFGKLTPKQWVQFIPMHQQLHKHQITEIIKRL